MNVVAFPSQAALYQPIGHFIRLGDSGYKKNAELHAQNLLRAKRFVVNGSRIGFQREDIRMLREGGAEVVLDPRTVELGSAKYCGGDAAKAPWALADGSVLTQDLRVPGHIFDLYGRVARCAVDLQVDTVLGPSSLVTGGDFKTAFNIDRAACLAMRSTLDANGGKEIALDYLLAVRLIDLTDEKRRLELMAGLSDLPFENLWLRIATSGGTAGPMTAQRLIKVLSAIHNIGRPIILDYTGGLTGEALISMNVVSGVAHGIGERGSFNVSGWDKAPRKLNEDEERKGGRAARVDVPVFGRSFTIPEMETLLSAKGAKSLLVPTDKRILPDGPSDLRSDVRRLNALEAERRIDVIETTPTVKRPEAFAEVRMKEAEQAARKAARLMPSAKVAVENKIDAHKLRARLAENAATIGKLRDVYVAQAEERRERGNIARAVSPPRHATPYSDTGS